MRSAILNITFDSTDPQRLAAFWSQVTRRPASFHDMPGNPFWTVGGEGGVSLVFVRVPEAKATKNRLHLDLVPHDGSQDAELARLQSLGAHIQDDRRTKSPGGWVILTDPENNEFCLEAGD
ncbi:VOC family protein [Kribbella sp. NPDC059898]|uniref:VOC family protein n=1 Tax=Kribbella sp. NPDC059898 TaxID=3346995 RepID=UPI00365ECC99